MAMRSNNGEPSRSGATETYGSARAPRSTLTTLALHGSEGNAVSFRATLDQWNDLWQEDQVLPPLRLEVTALNAPHRKPEASTDGFSWWLMPPGVRSFTAAEYVGFEDSASRVLTALRQEAHPIDLVVAHSQGAILIVALLALQRLDPQCHPRLGYVLNGVAWPKPFTEQLQHLPSDNLSGVRILLLVGQRDRINPPDQAHRVARALQRAGADVALLEHPGGHGVPVESADAGRELQAWLLRRSSSSLAGTDPTAPAATGRDRL